MSLGVPICVDPIAIISQRPLPSDGSPFPFVLPNQKFSSFNGTVSVWVQKKNKSIYIIENDAGMNEERVGTSTYHPTPLIISILERTVLIPISCRINIGSMS